ncbi:MAG: putative lipid II flippase FtsW [Pseudomonadales bacterium]|nr:putative lipid II flippase FtsW [Pseudomonadales bacterium]
MSIANTADTTVIAVEFKQGVSGINTLLLVFVLLMSMGLLMMTSASVELGNSNYGDPFYFIKRQLVFLLLSVMLMALTIKIRLNFWYSSSGILLLGGFVMLVLVLIPGVGKVVNGSARWLDLGFYNLQPSELSKVFLIMYMAAFLERHRQEVIARWSGFIKPMIILSAAVVLLHFEPDHGAMVIMMVTTFGMIFLAGAKLHRFMLILILGFGAVVSLAIMKPYVIARLSSFLNPWAAEYVYGEGYQLTQALIGFGRGEWFGVGLGKSIQKLYFLPEAHTDFILAIVAEELGLLGVLVLIALFTALIHIGLQTGKTAERQFAYFRAYLAYGIALLFAVQVLINIGVSTGLLPTKGLTLPFLSYGGNSLLSSCFLVAILLRVQYENSQPESKGGFHER